MADADESGQNEEEAIEQPKIKSSLFAANSEGNDSTTELRSSMRPKVRPQQRVAKPGRIGR